MLISAEALDLFNPYHDDKGRFTSRAHASRLGVEEESLAHGGKKYKTHVLRGESAWHIARETFRNIREEWEHMDIGAKAEAAFDHYIITGYEGINATLRGNEKKVEHLLDTFYKHRIISRDAMKRKFARHGQELIDAINKHKIKEDIVLFRNVSGQAAGDIHKAVSYGAHVLLDKGILSCALFQDVEQAKYPDKLPVAILVKKGSPGLVTRNAEELEVLLPPQEFNVIGWQHLVSTGVRTLVLESTTLAERELADVDSAVELFNPYHDAKGRFTSRAGSASPVDRVGVNVERGVARFEGEEYHVARPQEDKQVNSWADFRDKFAAARRLQAALLTEDETHAVREYISIGFTVINSYLRKYVPEDPDFTATMATWLNRVGGIPQEYLDYLVEEFGSADNQSIRNNLDARDIEDIILNYTPSALKKLAEDAIKAATRHKLPDNITLFRWASDEGLVEDLQRGLADNLIGDVVADDGMISTTYAAADQGYVAKGPLLAILKRAGQSGLFTQNDQELEVLLPPQTLDIVDIGPVPFPSRFIEGITGMAPNERQVIYLAGGI